MQSRMWPLTLTAAASALVVVSLSLPWQASSCGGSGSAFFPAAGGGPSVALPNLGICSLVRVDGWSWVGDGAALAAVFLAVLAGWLVAAQTAPRRTPILVGALLVGYLTAGVAVHTAFEARNGERVLGAGHGVHLHVAYGTFVGLAGAALALAGAAALVRPSFSWSRAAAAIPAGGLLVALLLPWQRGTVSPHLTQIGLSSPAGMIAAAAAAILVAWRLTPPTRVCAALAAAFFAVVALDVGLGASRTYGAWLGLVFAVLLVVGPARDLSRLRRRPSLLQAVTAVPAAAFALSLFLPWQHACYARIPSYAAAGVSGRCVSTHGSGLAGSAAGLLALALAASTFVPSGRRISRGQLGSALALLVATVGFQLEDGAQQGIRLSFGYGAFLGFASAAVLVATALVPLARIRPRAELVPVAGALAYVAAVALPWWGILPAGLWATFVAPLARISWLTVASALLGLRVVGLWLERSGEGERPGELVAASLALVALTLLETLPLPDVRLTWNMAVLLGLAAALAVHAVVETRGGWRRVPVPEILRVDRIA